MFLSTKFRHMNLSSQSVKRYWKHMQLYITENKKENLTETETIRKLLQKAIKINALNSQEIQQQSFIPTSFVAEIMETYKCITLYIFS